jgi:very-short-patch-repair endonuclease
MKAIPDILKNASRELRKNMTEAENILWNQLRAKKLD